MIRRLALAATATFLVAAGVALAAPARTVTVAADAPATWEGGPGNGVGQGVAAVRCTPAIYECEDTLVDLKAAGDLVAEIKGDDNAVDLDVAIYASDAEGTAPPPGDDTGQAIAEDVSTNKDAKATARKLQPGFYVVRVRFFDAIAASYTGTASVKVPPPPEPPAAPAAPPPSPPAQPAPKKSSSAKAKCRKKAKKIKNKKKRKRALKRCRRKG